MYPSYNIVSHVLLYDVFLVHWDRREYNKNLLITTKVLYFNEKIALLCLKVIRLLVKCCKICISSSILGFHSINILQSPYDIMKTNTMINIQTSCCHKYCSLRKHLKTIFVFCLLIIKKHPFGGVVFTLYLSA